jgi:hypothetical protein
LPFISSSSIAIACLYLLRMILNTNSASHGQ